MLPRQKKKDQVGFLFSFVGRRALFRYVGIQPPQRLATEGPTEALRAQRKCDWAS